MNQGYFYKLHVNGYWKMFKTFTLDSKEADKSTKNFGGLFFYSPCTWTTTTPMSMTNTTTAIIFLACGSIKINLQGVPQYCIHFCFLNFKLCSSLEIPSWTFFNNPFCVDFETIQFSIILWNLDQDICKILQGYH